MSETMSAVRGGEPRVIIVLFTRDLRVHDQPALGEAARSASHVVPLFVLDDEVLRTFGAPNRVAFLVDALRDLRESLRSLGADLIVRQGDPIAEVVRLARRVGAAAVFLSEDSSAYAQERERRFTAACAEARLELRTFPCSSIVGAGDLAPAGGTHYRVFTPYWRRWASVRRRGLEAAPARLRLPQRLAPGRIPTARSLVGGSRSPCLPHGGERAGRVQLERWLSDGLARYAEERDNLGADVTSRLSPYLHFGCLSPLELAERARGREGAEELLRQLCWRDFFGQLLAANPESSREDLRSRGDRWRRDDEALARWREGETGVPIVDAGMRQLSTEGWMAGRARLIVGSFLAKSLYLDWREGARHFFELLVDGDVASNVGNWQWVAGTGADTRPNRVLNPLRQAQRFDPHGEYVRRHVSQLSTVEGLHVHEPWKLGSARPRDYPLPLLDLDEARGRFLAERSRDSHA